MKPADRNRLSAAIGPVVTAMTEAGAQAMAMAMAAKAGNLTHAEGVSCMHVALAFVVVNMGAPSPDPAFWISEFKNILDWPEIREHQKTMRNQVMAAVRRNNIKGVPK